MLPFTTLYPRNVSMFGTEHMPSVVALCSIVTTQGVLCIEAPDGNEFYIFQDGYTPSFGGVNEVMAGTIGTTGQAIGPPVTPVPPVGSYRDLLSTYGSQRVSSSVILCSNPAMNRSGALAMQTGHGNLAVWMWLFGAGPNAWALVCGTEQQYISGVAGSAIVAPPVVGSGALGRVREGRTVIGNSNASQILPGIMFIQSGGRGAGMAFEYGGSDEQGNGILMYFPDPIGVPLFVTADAWLAWNGS